MRNAEQVNTLKSLDRTVNFSAVSHASNNNCSRNNVTFNKTELFLLSQDQGNPPRSSTTTLYVNVIDADDQNPAFLNDQYKVIVPRHVKGVRSYDTHTRF